MGLSTVTEPVAGRVYIKDAAILRRAAEREGITVSELLKRIVSEASPRLAAA